MGHYDRKDPCPTCGTWEWNCRCPVPEVKREPSWIVTRDFEVVETSELVGQDVIALLHEPQFSTIRAAANHRIIRIDSRIEELEEELKHLKILRGKKNVT